MSTDQPPQGTADPLLQPDVAPRPKRWRRVGWWLSGWRLLILLVLIGGGAAGAYALRGDEDTEGPAFRFATVERGPIDSTVSASGTLKALTTVEVGSQISGQIEAIYVDFNSQVKKNQVIARIDPETFKSKVKEAESNLKVAVATLAAERARLKAVGADILAAEAALAEARNDLARKKSLVDRRHTSRADYDKAVSAHAQAEARLASLRAGREEQAAKVHIAEARVEQNQAVLEQRKIDLDRTVIRSPVDGVVIARAVDVGQTVAASLQAPVLFKIAQDLRKMQVEVRVDEADIGRISEEQSVEFTVDAFSNRVFRGRVKQVRKEPKEESNVVTYTVIVTAENDDLRLLPGMTATVTFFISRRENVLKVANAALRFRPPGKGRANADPRALRNEMRKRAAEERKKLEARLKLTKGQKAAMRQLRTAMRQQFRQVFMANQGNRPAIVKAIATMRKEFEAKVLALLTPEQRVI
jgi:HlyD family secretion protein